MKSLYKIFLVEDEIVTRENIRACINWEKIGYEFCGEAPDGEIALHEIQKLQPDVLITDIKMPFMNGLELCRIVHETMPHIKTVILSGHDEFEYARDAIKLGVTEYLLKPISPQELETVLVKLAEQIEEDTGEQERIRALQNQISDNLSLLREKFLMRLVTGEISSVEAIKQSIPLNLSIIARWYKVIFINLDMQSLEAGQMNDVLKTSAKLIFDVTRRNADVLILNKGINEFVLILKGDREEHLAQDSYLLIEAIREEISNKTGCTAHFGVSQPCEHIGDIPSALMAALRDAQPETSDDRGIKPAESVRPLELVKLDTEATETFLRHGAAANFEAYFAQYTQDVETSVLESRLFLEYIMMDVLISTANVINELGGNPAMMIPELGESGLIIQEGLSIEQLKQWMEAVLTRVIDFRDEVADSPNGRIIKVAQKFIDNHFDDPELSLKTVADHVNLSMSHFCVVFSREAKSTFIEYLTNKRIEKAKNLLLTTEMRATEISERVGYDNPHYFSTVFKKFTGESPMRYRAKMLDQLSGGK